MLNVSKCTFLSKKVSTVGMEVVNGEYAAKPSKVESLFSSRAPTMLRELQKLMGTLNYFRKFIPGFAQLTAPIKKLLSPGSNNTWSLECHKALQGACTALKKVLKLRIANPSFPFFLYVDASPEGIAAVMC